MSDYLPKNAKFSLGQIVYHSKFKYRGVIVDADPNFQGTDEWYDSVAKSKDQDNQAWGGACCNYGKEGRTYILSKSGGYCTFSTYIDSKELVYDEVKWSD